MDLTKIDTIVRSRPQADHSVEQYLMTASSLVSQIKLLDSILRDKKIIYIGDDDHFSLLSSLYLNSENLVLEIDDRIIQNQTKISKELGVHNHTILKYDVNSDLNDGYKNAFDVFIVNPPYGSKNQGYGSKVWISRALGSLKPGGLGIIVLPITFEKKWSICNMFNIQKFLISNNCVIVDIHKNIHSYEDLPEKDESMKSSNIIIQYFGSATNLIEIVDKSLYR